jgi:hypothetical protein
LDKATANDVPKSGQPYVAKYFWEIWARGGGRAWPAATLKKLRITKMTQVVTVSSEEKDHLRGLLTKEES